MNIKKVTKNSQDKPQLPVIHQETPINLLEERLKTRKEGEKFVVEHRSSIIMGENFSELVNGDILVLKAPKNSDAVALNYSTDLNSDKPQVTIHFIQKPRGVMLSKAKASLHTHPYEVLTANFLGRLKPILEQLPQTEVVLVGEHDMNDTRTRNRTYTKIRDRFFDDNWRLNLDRKRVKEILGDELIDKMKKARLEKKR